MVRLDKNIEKECTMKIAIIGSGIVGNNMHKIFPEAVMIDCKPGYLLTTPEWVDLAFVCVPTPMLPDRSCDTSIVEKVVRENRAGVFCIKSTIPPGTTNRLADETGEAIVFSPEFFGETQHANGVDYDFVIIGGSRKHSFVVAEAFKQKMPASFRIIKTDATTAELVKYAENSFLATKVTFFNEFYRLCKNLEVDVDEFREVLLNDPRIGRSHTFTYRDHPWYTSKCFDKDIPAIIFAAAKNGVAMHLLSAVHNANLIYKRDGK
jgi:UDPglucose 6-dehydrogenase